MFSEIISGFFSFSADGWAIFLRAKRWRRENENVGPTVMNSYENIPGKEGSESLRKAHMVVENQVISGGVHVLAFCKTDQVDRCWHSSHFSSTCVRSCFVVEKVPRGARGEVAIRHRLNSNAAADDLFGHKPAKNCFNTRQQRVSQDPINAKTKLRRNSWNSATQDL